MGTLRDYGKMSQAVLERVLGPFVGRRELSEAVGYVENAGVPTSVTPDFIGQMLFDTTNLDFYRAFGTSSGNWAPAGLDTLSATELSYLDGALSTNSVASKAAILNSAGQLSLDNNKLATGPAAGITGGVGALCKTSVEKIGEIIYTSIMIDLTGLGSSTTDLDIIGQGASAAYLGQITAAQNGTIFSGRVTCIKAPATGVTDIDLYSATEATGKFDDAVTGLTETALLTKGGAWSASTFSALTTLPAANGYLYLTGGAGGTAGTYTAGKFLIELEGY